MQTDELEALKTLALGHPYLAALVAVLAVLTLILGRLAQVDLTREEAVARPRYASAVIFAKHALPVVRGMLKAAVGIWSPKAAELVVKTFFPEDGSVVVPVSNPGGKS